MKKINNLISAAVAYGIGYMCGKHNLKIEQEELNSVSNKYSASCLQKDGTLNKDISEGIIADLGLYTICYDFGDVRMWLSLSDGDSMYCDFFDIMKQIIL